MSSNIVRFDPIRSAANGVITNAYVALGAVLGHATRVLHFINGTNGDIFVSFDGTTDNAIILASTFALYDLTSDQDENESFRYEKGTQVYIKYSSAPSSGSFYMVAIYGKGE